jgi:hypothetical protein
MSDILDAMVSHAEYVTGLLVAYVALLIFDFIFGLIARKGG